MKLLSLSAASAFFAHHASTHLVRAATCAPDPLEFSETVAVRVEKVGSVPAPDGAPFSYNMAVMDNVAGDTLYFLDQKNGKIYAHDAATGEQATLFDAGVAGAVPPGLTLDWAYGGAGQTYRVKAVARGRSADELVVVFTSSTLPPGWSRGDARLPPPGAYGKFAGNAKSGPLVWIEDLYRPGLLPDNFDNGAGLTTLVGYDVFYTYTQVNGQLTDPSPFFVSESNIAPGHLGGGIATLANGSILWSTGDCSLYGIDGAYAPQLDQETCGKILLINPSRKGAYRIVAKGVRNSQQMRFFGEKVQKPGKGGKGGKGVKSKSGKGKAEFEYLAFMDIGGVTAEEVNAVAVADLMDDGAVPNFGWGRSIVDGKAREGTFHVGAGIPGVLGTQPLCLDAVVASEAGYSGPWIQFGRTATDTFYAISSLAVPTEGAGTLTLLWSEFNTGKVMGTTGAFVPGAPPVKGYKLKVYDADGTYLENGLNDLVKAELGEVGFYRGDPRLFHYPDGTVGVFVERTGAFYRLTEIAHPARRD